MVVIFSQDPQYKSLNVYKEINVLRTLNVYYCIFFQIRFIKCPVKGQTGGRVQSLSAGWKLIATASCNVHSNTVHMI